MALKLRIGASASLSSPDLLNRGTAADKYTCKVCSCAVAAGVAVASVPKGEPGQGLH